MSDDLEQQLEEIEVLKSIYEEAEQWLGCAMTYTLFECLKERVSDILAEQTEQARRAWDKAEMGKAGEKPRGWDWVDIVKHLSHVPHQPAVPSAASS
ncbi:Small androgen receptor-interacting protein [Operophtera brumata]|uniref:Small androgen receptor-interacting protein n=1 Tax=Operophtera brumata TaxID=104452 RepID=A0A0L7L395_OPEBR|nr:Small androgen receptor-interacting protein [Operophtera brumata]